MSSLTISLVTLACTLGGMLFGILLHNRLPEKHFRDDSKDVMKTATGMMATLVALIIGLLVSSAKSTFDAVSGSITQNGAKIITLDRILSRYGPEAKVVREHLRSSVESGIERIWPEDATRAEALAGRDKAPGMEDVYDRVRELPAPTEAQQYLKSQALQINADLMQSRWLLVEQAQTNLPTIFLVALTFWLTALFVGFGLLSPRNLTAMTALFICAVSMAGAIYMILELNHPLDGTIKVSNAPLFKALAVMGK